MKKPLTFKERHRNLLEELCRGMSKKDYEARKHERVAPGISIKKYVSMQKYFGHIAEDNDTIYLKTRSVRERVLNKKPYDLAGPTITTTRKR